MDKLLEKFMNLPTPQKALIFIVLMALIAAGWYNFFYQETASALNRESATTSKLNKDLLAENDIEQNIEIYKQEIAVLERSRDELRQRLPDNAKIAELLQQVHDQAKITGLEMSRFQRGKPEEMPMYTRIPVNMELNGTFNEITAFFYYLGKLKRIVNVENISLSLASKHDESVNRLKATCVATTYMSQSTAGGQK